ncbi:MAG: transporter substrate-binding domain-containing protein [Burkholderiaceae bacterium]
MIVSNKRLGNRFPIRVLLAFTFAFTLACLSWPAQAQAQDKLTVSVVERAPFVMKNGDGVKGFSIDLWNAISREIGHTSTYQLSASFAEMLKQVTDKSAPLAIANISITAEREAALDFSHPIFDSGLQILVPASGSGGGLLNAILNWRMLSLLLAAVAVTFLIGNLMWYFEKDKSPYFQRSYRDGMWPSFWWAMHALISGGFEEHVPRSIPGRVLGTTLLISTLFLVSAFVATLTSAMTLSELRADIQSVNDLHDKRVGTTKGSTASNLLKERGIRHIEVDSLEQLFSDVGSKQLDAIVHDAPILAYYAATRGKGRVQTTGRIFRAEKYGIALPDGSPLTEPINRALLKIRESGEYDDLYRKWFGSN